MCCGNTANFWLRSANRGNANNEYNINNRGNSNNNNANNAYSVAADCIDHFYRVPARNAGVKEHLIRYKEPNACLNWSISTNLTNNCAAMRVYFYELRSLLRRTHNKGVGHGTYYWV